MLVRPATLADFERVNDVLYSALGVVNSRRFFEQKLRAGRLYVCEVAGEVVGVVDVVDEGVAMYIAALAVRADWRGRGVGRTLVDFVLRLAEDAGKTYVYAHPLGSSEGFFVRVGFSVWERWDGMLFERVAVRPVGERLRTRFAARRSP